MSAKLEGKQLSQSVQTQKIFFFQKHCLSKVGTADQIEAARAILPSDIPKRALKKFDESNKEFSDVIFVVEHNKFYVLKQVCFSFLL